MDEKELIKTLTETAQRAKSNTHRIDELETNQEAVTELALSVRAMATEQGNIKTDLAEVKTDVKSLALKSGKRWDVMVEKTAWLVIGGLLAYLMSQVGIG